MRTTTVGGKDRYCVHAAPVWRLTRPLAAPSATSKSLAPGPRGRSANGGNGAGNGRARAAACDARERFAVFGGDMVGCLRPGRRSAAFPRLGPRRRRVDDPPGGGAAVPVVQRGGRSPDVPG